MIHEYFPEVAIAIQKEILDNHPKLSTYLQQLPEETPLDERFAYIFAYCGMVVDGYYEEAQLSYLLGEAYNRLRLGGMTIVQ